MTSTAPATRDAATGMAYRDEGPGDGPAVVMLNGLFQAMPAWQPLIERLPRSVRRVGMDLPNQGPGPVRRDCARFDDYCDAVDAFLAARGLAPADTVLVGFSFGAEIARALAHERRRPFRHLILAAVSPPGLGRFWRLWFRTLAAAADTGGVDAVVRAIAFHMFSPTFFQAQPRAFDVMLMRYREYYGEQPEKLALLAGAPLDRDFEAEQTDRSFAMPVDLIAPRHDSLIPAPRLADHARRIGATLHDVDAGHTVVVEAPDAVASVIGRALSGADPAPTGPAFPARLSGA